MFTPSSERVLANTSAMVTDQIRRRSEVSVHYYKDHLEEIEHRLWELDREWDVERVLQTTDAGVTLLFLFLCLFSRWWLFLLIVVQVFALIHALHGWSPVLLILRHAGFRTQGEIEWERYALKELRTMSLPLSDLTISTPPGSVIATPAPAPGSAAPGAPASTPEGGAAASATESGVVAPAAGSPTAESAPAPAAGAAATSDSATPQVKQVEGLGPVEIQI